ncbi:MAG: DNA internalization-related competence protein ComEC/Rec2 [Burkholderiaceae bacterium]
MQERADTGVRLAALALAWVAGIALHLQQRTLWPIDAELAATVLGAIGVAAAWRWRRAFALGLAGVVLLAFGAAGVRASLRLADALPPALEGRDIAVTGVVASLPQRSAAGLRFRFEVDSAALDGQAVKLPALLALGWYRGQHEDAALGEPQTELRAGQRWRFTLRLRQPHGNLNPHGFDYELQLFEQGVRATGYVRDAPSAHLVDRRDAPSARPVDRRDAPVPELLQRAAGFPVERLRQRVRDAIFATVPDPRAAGVLAALAVGDQGAIERDDWDLYRNTGIAHLVSISGLHITMFAWLASAVVAWLWRRSTRAMLWRPAPLAGSLGGLACAAAYAVFSGWGVPSQRTVWMLAVVTLARAGGLRWPWALVLLVAAVVVTAFDPWALLQAGFWLSFAAVGLLMASSASGDRSAVAVPAGWRGWPRRAWGTLRTGLRTQLLATVGLAPLSLVFFQQLSLVGFVANLIAIPLVTLVITPLALLGVALLPLWRVGAWVVQQLNAALGLLAAWPGAVWVVPVAPAWAQLAGLLGAVLLVLPLPWRVRLLALPLLVPLLWPPRVLPPPGGFDLLALDVGQGTAVLLRTRAHLLVFDAGPQYSRESDAGQRVLLPLLRARGESRIDRLVLSHRDLDHVGGAGAVLRAMPVDDVLSSLDPVHPLLGLARHTTRCSAGQSWEWDGVRFEVLRPAAGDYERTLKANAMSCVLRVSSAPRGAQAGHSVLLTGDIEREQESALLADAAEALRSEVLIVPHHGSKTSSTPAFLAAVQPRVAVFQAGYRNRFGHPAPEVLQRYRERGIAIVASPACGAYRWDAARTPADTAAGGSCQRDTVRRYWHHGAAYRE